ncbi:hypothetical protein M3J09_000136 [Ascochyta lentis]
MLDTLYRIAISSASSSVVTIRGNVTPGQCPHSVHNVRPAICPVVSAFARSICSHLWMHHSKKACWLMIYPADI